MRSVSMREGLVAADVRARRLPPVANRCLFVSRGCWLHGCVMVVAWFVRLLIVCVGLFLLQVAVVVTNHSTLDWTALQGYAGVVVDTRRVACANSSSRAPALLCARAASTLSRDSSAEIACPTLAASPSTRPSACIRSPARVSASLNWPRSRDTEFGTLRRHCTSPGLVMSSPRARLNGTERRVTLRRRFCGGI